MTADSTDCPDGFVPLHPDAQNWKTDANICFELPKSRIMLGWLVFILAVFSLVKELYQIFQERLEYFLESTNYVEWGLYLTTLIFVLDANSLTAATGVKSHWQWQIGSIAILLSWLELMLFIQKLPRIGIYVLMFQRLGFYDLFKVGFRRSSILNLSVV